MAARAHENRRAIEASVDPSTDKKNPPVASRDEDGALPEVDQELKNYFSGAYKADAGLHSGLGNAGSGASAKIPDGWNEAVKFGHHGPWGRLELSRVTAALDLLEEQHLPPLRAYYTERPRGTFDGLDLFFDKRGRGMAAVATVTETAHVLTDEWCKRRCEVDIGTARAAQAESVDENKRAEMTKAAEARLEELRAELQRRRARKPRRTQAAAVRAKWEAGIDIVARQIERTRRRLHELKRPPRATAAKEAEARLERARDQLRRRRASAPHPPLSLDYCSKWEARTEQLVRQIEQTRRRVHELKRPPPSPDTERGIHARWAVRSEQVAVAALRELCTAATGKKATHERRHAKLRVRHIIVEAERIWREARDAYAKARTEVRKNIRKVEKARRDRDVDDFISSLKPDVRAEED